VDVDSVRCRQVTQAELLESVPDLAQPAMGQLVTDELPLPVPRDEQSRPTVVDLVESAGSAE
jgi:hypothetical protein